MIHMMSGNGRIPDYVKRRRNDLIISEDQCKKDLCNLPDGFFLPTVALTNTSKQLVLSHLTCFSISHMEVLKEVVSQWIICVRQVILLLIPFHPAFLFTWINFSILLVYSFLLTSDHLDVTSLFQMQAHHMFAVTTCLEVNAEKGTELLSGLIRTSMWPDGGPSVITLFSWERHLSCPL